MSKILENIHYFMVELVSNFLPHPVAEKGIFRDLDGVSPTT